MPVDMTVTYADRMRVIEHEATLGWPSRERVVLAFARKVEAFADSYPRHVVKAATNLLLQTRTGFGTDDYRWLLGVVDDLDKDRQPWF